MPTWLKGRSVLPRNNTLQYIGNARDHFHHNIGPFSNLTGSAANKLLIRMRLGRISYTIGPHFIADNDDMRTTSEKSIQVVAQLGTSDVGMFDALFREQGVRHHVSQTLEKRRATREALIIEHET